VLLGGFGLSDDPMDPFKPSNPMDIWVSKDGAQWEQVSDSPWNATSPEDIKYDFEALALPGGKGGDQPSILTFGGDRETFDFTDPTNYLNVDNDVWRYSPSKNTFSDIFVQSVNVTAVPEPTSLALVSLGFLVLFSRRRV